MPNLVTLRPGARGTKGLTRKYGSRLLFVRYRYDAQMYKRLKTVELIVDECPWTPKHAPVEYLSLFLEEEDADLLQAIEQHGGRFDADRGLWTLPGYKVHVLGLEHRVVYDAPPPRLTETTGDGP